MDHIVSNLIRIKEEINSKNLKKKQNIPTKIIAVSKTFSENKIYPLIEYGHNDFGENKVQEAMDKWVKIKEKYNNLNLHMIGKLQTNKVKNAVKIFDYIHSVDSIKLAKKIYEEQNRFIEGFESSLSFKDTFRKMRAEYGAGYVFHWNERLFTTYYAEEVNVNK